MIKGVDYYINDKVFWCLLKSIILKEATVAAKAVCTAPMIMKMCRSQTERCC